jgi:hypothetical protein
VRVFSFVNFFGHPFDIYREPIHVGDLHFGRVAAAEKTEQASPANPGAGFGGNLDVTA